MKVMTCGEIIEKYGNGVEVYNCRTDGSLYCADKYIMTKEYGDFVRIKGEKLCSPDGTTYRLGDKNFIPCVVWDNKDKQFIWQVWVVDKADKIFYNESEAKTYAINKFREYITYDYIVDNDGHVRLLGEFSKGVWIKKINNLITSESFQLGEWYKCLTNPKYLCCLDMNKNPLIFNLETKKFALYIPTGSLISSLHFYVEPVKIKDYL